MMRHVEEKREEKKLVVNEYQCTARCLDVFG